MALTQVRPAGLDLRSGSIIQVQYTQFTGTSVNSLSGDTVLTDLTVNITPTSTSSIIKLEAMVNGEWGASDASHESVWFFYRDTTKLSAPEAGSRKVGILSGTFRSYDAVDASSTPEHAVYSYIDSPSSTSQITYKVGVSQGLNRSWFLNRTVADSDAAGFERGTSLILATEIAG